MAYGSQFFKIQDCEKLPKYMMDILVSLLLSFEIENFYQKKNVFFPMQETLDMLKKFLDGYGLLESFSSLVKSREIMNTYGDRQMVTYVGEEMFLPKNTIEDGYILLERFLNVHLQNGSLVDPALKVAMKLSLDDYLEGHYFRKMFLKQGIEEAKKLEIARQLLGYEPQISISWEDDWVMEVLTQFRQDGFMMEEACQHLLVVLLGCFLHQCLLDSSWRSKVLLIFDGTILAELNIPYTDMISINLALFKRKEFLTSFEQEVCYLKEGVPTYIEKEEKTLTPVLPEIEERETVCRSFWWKRPVFVYGSLFCVLFVVLGTSLLEGRHFKSDTSYVDTTEYVVELQQQVLALYERDNVPKTGITKEELSYLEKKFSKVSNQAEVQPYLKQVHALYDYVAMEEFLKKSFLDGNLKYPVVEADLEELDKLYQALLSEYQPLFQERYFQFTNQYQAIEEAREAIGKLFQDTNLNSVKSGVTQDDKDMVYQLFIKLPQKQMLEQYEVAFTRIDTYLKKQEEEEKRQEEIRKKQELIQKSYVKIKGVPFISQKDSEVFNGCEAASLLMALQYYGLATQYDLVSFAQIFPKHDTDPHQGFVFDIFKREPYDVVHWIAPDALVRYARTYMSASDISGKDVTSITSYIEQGKPVIAYVTDEFKPVKKWVGGVPLNMHVVLVVGYNTYNGSYVVYDPYWGELIVEKDKFEMSYQILKYGVVVG